MNENKMEVGTDPNGMERPWYSVRAALLAALVILVCLLATLLSQPQLLDLGFSLAGL